MSHGAGFFINCHEGPQSIRLNDVPTPLEPGMITSDEPGIYLEGRYGIRLENLIVTEKLETTEFGDFYHFGVLTLFPFDTSMLDTSIMTAEEIEWLNSYHARVYSELSPLLEKEEQDWLKAKCAPVSK